MGEVARSVVAIGGCGKTDEGHVKRDFGSGMGVAAAGIWQVWWG